MPPKDKPQPAATERDLLLGWIAAFLDQLARTRDGDPGPVVLRRLSNAEYTHTLRDLTGVDSLDPAREFPVDGAAGEGFVNTGSALVMSPALLTKYLDAARDVAGHAVLLPDGFRFSPSTSRRDWTEELLSRIREFYRQYTDPRGSTRVNLQGLVWDTNEGGRLPLDRYLRTLLETHPSLPPPAATLEARASQAGLSPKYLGILARALADPEPSVLLDPFRATFRAADPSQAADVASRLAADIGRWQQALWKFNSVGHVGKVGGPTAWMEPVQPIVPRQDLRLKFTNAPIDGRFTVRLLAGNAGDGRADDLVLWERPRLVAPGRPDLLLRDVRAWLSELTRLRPRVIATASRCLAIAAEAERNAGQLANLTLDSDVDADVLTAWLDYLGVGASAPVTLTGHLTNRLERIAGFDFVHGWGSPETPNLAANSSDRPVRIPGNLRPHSVAIHPSPTLQVAIGWRSPVRATLRIEAVIGHAHPECGNGVVWSLERRRGSTRQRLAAGTAQGGNPVRPAPVEGVVVRTGDVVSLLIGPRDGNHACDLTAVDLNLIETNVDDSTAPREWSLARDVSADILAGNPLTDRFGHAEVWHFYTEPVAGRPDSDPIVPPGSLLARWQASTDDASRQQLAAELQQLLATPPPADAQAPDAVLQRQLLAPTGPLFRQIFTRWRTRLALANASTPAAFPIDAPGLDPSRFGRHPDGTTPVDAPNLCIQAPEVVEFDVPAELAVGSEFVVGGRLHPDAGAEGSVQLRAEVVAPGTPVPELSSLDAERPVVLADSSRARRRLEAAFDAFRDVFPAALCYTKIVPVDEVVTLTLYYREDDALRRLMLDDSQAAQLDRLWDELRYVSQDALALVDAFAQLMEYATQDADPSVFAPLRQPIEARAAAFRERLRESEPGHLDALVAFAARAWRRPLREAEVRELRTFYASQRAEGMPHEEAFRLTLARLFVAPGFLYRFEEPGPGIDAVPVTDSELASRLSYFLWSSVPDASLESAAAAGRLRDPAVLVSETRRMLRDPRVRRLAIEFGCQWLHIRDLDQLDEKSERHFPTFSKLRADLYEEAIRFFTDFFQSNLPVRTLLDADHTFVNGPLAAHYAIPGIGIGDDDWQRVDRVREYGRGGVLGFAATLARQSGASRTSPILRGNWISEILLGERLPRPPKDVPQLPEDEADTEGLTVRQLVERHSSDPRCAGCHIRIDPYGFALEGFDAIGRRRQTDLANRPIETRARTADGAEFEGLDGLRDYLLHRRRDAFLRQFSRKLLGYALGRAVQLSDGPLLDRIQTLLAAPDARVGAVVETIVLSRQFREIRGREMADASDAGGATP